MPDTTGDRSLTGRRGENHQLGLCYTMLLDELTIYSLLLLQDGGYQKRSLRKDRLSPFYSDILQFSPHMIPLFHLIPMHTYVV